jgi:flagellar assembly protein FliH
VAKKIFKAGDIKEIGSKVLITPPQFRPKEIEKAPEPEIEEVEEAEPIEVETVEEIKDEQKKILEETKRLKAEAEAEVERIRKDAEEAAFKLMQKSNVDVRKLKEDAENEAEKLVTDAEAKAAQLEEEAQSKAEAILEEGKRNAAESGREQGFKEGQEEVSRLIERLHAILDEANDKRKEILDSTERQVVDLVLIIARKVVKVISEASQKVVLENVRQALSKVKGETEITIKVNTRDLNLTTRHKKAFIAQVESLKQVRIEEDSRVKPGGCVIETSFGDIDARIEKQLDIIEERIRELIPIKE